MSASNADASKVDTGNAAADLERLGFAEDLGDDEELYVEAWTLVKAAP